MDSDLVVQALNKVLNNDMIPVNANSNLVMAIKSYLIENWTVKIHHIYQEGNRCAGYLVNHAFH